MNKTNRSITLDEDKQITKRTKKCVREQKKKIIIINEPNISSYPTTSRASISTGYIYR